jgi:dihydroorotase
MYTTCFTIAMYIQFFERLECLEKCNRFLSCFSASFCQLLINKEELVLLKKFQHIPKKMLFGDSYMIYFTAGTQLQWSRYVSL